MYNRDGAGAKDLNETTTDAELENESTENESKDGISRFFGPSKNILEKYNHCCFCGSNLHFTHITDFSRNLTQETARCPECGVKARQLQHKLQ